MTGGGEDDDTDYEPMIEACIACGRDFDIEEYEFYRTPAEKFMHKHCYEIVEGERYHRCGSDLVTRKDNVLEYGEKALCERCDGTGNELLGMYCECEKCHGTGLQQDARQDDTDAGVRGRQEIRDKREELEERNGSVVYEGAMGSVPARCDGEIRALDWVLGVRDDL